MYVIGTAGHVDHGKSTLVEALTGIDPDRLLEEKQREMTIDLGFAWLKPDQNLTGLDDDLDEIGVIDVPGHRDFIENMLAGIGGIDLALMVIAADEGVMPQTTEHLAILDLLQIKGGVVALTKTDLVDDADWFDLVVLDVSETLSGTILDGVPVIPVSAVTGQGLDELRTTMFSILGQIEPRLDIGRPRLPIDRTFTLPGFGTIVTGTLVDGSLHIRDEIEIQPSGAKARIRGLQTHKTKVEVAKPGSRVAINVAGADKKDSGRGNVLAKPGIMSVTRLIDVSYRHLGKSPAPIKHNMEVKLFVGSAEVMARTRVIGARQISSGQEGWLQLELHESIAVVRGDRFVLRRPSPPATIGGGEILDPVPKRQHRRFKPEVVTRLETLSKGTPEDILLTTLASLEPVQLGSLFEISGIDPQLVETVWRSLEEEDQVISIGDYALSKHGWDRLTRRLSVTLRKFHQQHPLRLGMPQEELRSRLKLTGSVFGPLLEASVADGFVTQDGQFLRAPEHEVTFSDEQQSAIDQTMNRFATEGINSPSVKETKRELGPDVYFVLLDQGILSQVSNEVVYMTEDYQELIAHIEAYLRENERINAAQLRDLLQTSRKYAIALLEHLDEKRITKRVGDDRILIKM